MPSSPTTPPKIDYGANAWSTCSHDGVVKVMAIGSCVIYAGSRVEVQAFDDWTLAIVCGDTSLLPKGRVFMSERAAAMLLDLGVPVVPHLRINWADSDTPGLSDHWWQKLVAALRKIDGMVSVNCMGGHGRTGTCLAILASLSGACKKTDDPVAWVRKVYCEDAVETKSQIDYVEAITGCEVAVKGSRIYTPVTPAASTGYWDDEKGVWIKGARPLSPSPSSSGSGSSMFPLADDDDDVDDPVIGSEEWWDEIEEENRHSRDGWS